MKARPKRPALQLPAATVPVRVCGRGDLGENVGMTSMLRIRPFPDDLGLAPDACLGLDELPDAS